MLDPNYDARPVGDAAQPDPPVPQEQLIPLAWDGPQSGIADPSNPIGEIETLDAGKMHAETLDAINAGLRRIYEAVTGIGQAIIQLDGGAGPVSVANVGLSHLRARIVGIIFSPATAGTTILLVGTRGYPFTLPATPTFVPFPLVIERGTDLAIDRDGRAYLLFIPE